MNKKIKLYGSLFIFMMVNFHVNSQSLTSSPYSYFGLGMIENKGFCETLATGSAGIAMPSIRYLNSTNPASYNGIDSSAFLFYLGLYGKFSEFESQGIKQNNFESNIRYIAFGFRVSKRWGSSFGLLPFSSRGYYITSTYPAEGDLGEYRLISTGSGNLNRFYYANSFALTKQLSIGANVSYLFGSLKNDEAMSYSDASFNSISIETTDYFRNLFLDFGLQYKFHIGLNDFYTGLTFNHLQKLNTNGEKLAINGSDTIAFKSVTRNNFTLPPSIGIGFGANCFSKQLKLMLDYKFMQWSKSDFESAKFEDSWQINTGAEFNSKNNRNYLNYINYQVGFRYEKSYLSIKGNRINEIAFTAGLGLPSKYDRTRINIAYEYAITGTTSDGLVRERYHKITLGLVLADKWFQRQKFN